MIDTLYTNGAIAVKEKQLLGDRIYRLAELSAGEAFRSLVESGFGSGSPAQSPSDAELLCAFEEAVLDEFIRTYAPSRAELIYLLAPRDFHNLKALVKARILDVSPEKFLAPEGLFPIEALSRSLDGEENTYPGVKEAFEQAKSATGAEVGMIFERLRQEYLLKSLGRFGTLKKLFAAKTDRRNLLSALRAESREEFSNVFLRGGNVKEDAVWAAREGKDSLKGDVKDFFRALMRAREQGQSFQPSERETESFETERFFEKRYDLKGKEPFLYYVFRRRAEISNVRILLVCLNAGFSEQEIRRRLRAV